jgi:hypothetical protein
MSEHCENKRHTIVALIVPAFKLAKVESLLLAPPLGNLLISKEISVWPAQGGGNSGTISVMVATLSVRLPAVAPQVGLA